MEYGIFPEGGSKVSVEGLSADVVLSGNTVTVKQGTKVVESVSGTLMGSITSVLNDRGVFGDYTTTTRTVTLNKGDMALLLCSGICGSGAGPSTSLNAPNCMVLLNEQKDLGNGGHGLQCVARIAIVKATQNTTVSLSAYIGTGWPAASFYAYKL